jgi:hypothetical protein
MPVHAEVQRSFTYSGVDPGVLVDEAVAMARQNGWHQAFRGSTGYYGRKKIDGVGANLTISTGEDNGASTFAIALSADSANG